MKLKKHLFPLLFFWPAAVFSQQYGLSVGHHTTSSKVFTNRDFRVFCGWHLSKKFVLMPEIGIRHLGFVSSGTGVLGLPTPSGPRTKTQPILGLLMTTPFSTVGRRNVLSLGGGFDLLPGRLYLHADWSRYRLGGSNAGFRIGLQPGFGGNPAFGGGESNNPILTTIALRIDVFHYVLPRELRKRIAF